MVRPPSSLVGVGRPATTFGPAEVVEQEVRKEVVEVHREVGEVVEEKELEQQKDEQWTGVTKKQPDNNFSVHLFGLAIPPAVETLGDPYYKRVPLPRVPEYRNLSQDPNLMKPPVKFANHQLSSQSLNQISAAIIPTDIVRYLDVDARQSRQRASDYHMLDIDIIFI